MTEPAPNAPFFATVDAFLAWAAEREGRFEFVEGAVRATAPCSAFPSSASPCRSTRCTPTCRRLRTARAPHKGLRARMVLHTTALDHFENLKREHARLCKAVHRGDLNNFIAIVNCLPEIIENDPICTKEQRKASAQIRRDNIWKISHEICNKQKHFRLTKGKAELVQRAEVRQGYGVGRYGRGTFGVGEQSIVIHLSDGSQYKALNLIDHLMGFFCPLFEIAS